uniref:BRCA-2_OB1 domain-containing protein n=1 Tax=Caenorhabditis tropicalis TaxID=1561998 RepID=A0A1I7TUT5_9PELO
MASRNQSLRSETISLEIDYSPTKDASALNQMDQLWNLMTDVENENIGFRSTRAEIIEWSKLSKRDVPKLVGECEKHNNELQKRMEHVSRLELRKMLFEKEKHPALGRAAEMMTCLSKQVVSTGRLIRCFHRHTMDIRFSGRLVARGKSIRQPVDGAMIVTARGFAEGTNVKILSTENPLEWTIEGNGQTKRVPSVYVQLKNAKTRMTSPIRLASPPQSPSLVTIESTLTSE